jgi:hypothetical protein
MKKLALALTVLAALTSAQALSKTVEKLPAIASYKEIQKVNINIEEIVVLSEWRRMCKVELAAKRACVRI